MLAGLVQNLNNAQLQHLLSKIQIALHISKVIDSALGMQALICHRTAFAANM